MIETRKKWQGQVVDAKFVLGEYLGGSNNTALFLTQDGDNSTQKAVIKLLPADPTSAERQLSLWRRAAQLSHPNLVSLLQFGRCMFQNTDMLYVVMEYQEENLAQILPLRPLTPVEARGLLEPVLGALAYLHSQGLAHGRIKPANILATGDQIKLSSDSVSPVGEPRSSLEETTAYDAPESATAPLSSVADVWSLGVTLVEALTLRVPTLQNAEHILPDALPSPFLEIARHSLRIDPASRWSIAEIAACLNPNSAKLATPSSTASPTAPSAVSPASISATPPKASSLVSSSPAAAAPSTSSTAVAPARSAAPPPPPVATVKPTSPLAVPLSPVPPLPRQQMPREADTRPQASSSSSMQSGSNSRNLLLGAAVFIVLIAVFAASKFFGHRDAVPPATTAVASPESAKPIVQPPPQSPAKSSSGSSVAPASPSQTKTSQPATANSLKTASEREALAKEDRPTFSASSAAPPASAASSNPGGRSARGEVLDQVLPDVSQKARDTIHGKVRVVVRVHVDASGNVSAADLDSPSPSKFFADLALQAARRWEFQSPEADGHSIPSEWLLRFEFTQTDTQVFPQQQIP
jgi:TonB family protein